MITYKNYKLENGVINYYNLNCVVVKYFHNQDLNPGLINKILISQHK